MADSMIGILSSNSHSDRLGPNYAAHSAIETFYMDGSQPVFPADPESTRNHPSTLLTLLTLMSCT